MSVIFFKELNFFLEKQNNVYEIYWTGLSKFLDHTNMPNYYLSQLAANTTQKKMKKNVYFFQ